MASIGRPAAGITGRIMRTTLLIGLGTVLAAGVVALISFTRLSSRQVEGYDLLMAQQVEDRLSSRLDLASDDLARVGTLVASEQAPEQAHKVLASLVGSNHPVFDRVLVVDRDGEVLVSSRSATESGTVSSLPAFRAAKEGTRGFLTTTGPAGQWQLWSVWASEGRRDPKRYLLAQLDTGFVASSLRHAAAENRHVLVVEGGLVLAEAGEGDAPELERARWSADSENSGRVLVRSTGTVMQGTYVNLTGTGSLDWRLVVLTPAVVPTGDTFRAVVPSVIVLLAGGVVALVAAWGVTVRLVRPLRELERAARVAASGSYVRPIEVHADDEIGRVAEAFNQVSVRLNALHDLSQLLASANQVDQVLDGVLSAMGHLVGPGVEAIYLHDEVQGQLVPRKVAGSRMSKPLSVRADGDGWLARALYSAEPLLLDASDDAESELPGLGGGAATAIAVPLVAGRERLGVVVALRSGDEGWSEAEREMLRTFSAQAAVAVQTSRLFEIESQSRRVAEALRAVAEELVRPDGLDRALRRIEGVVADLFGAAAASIVVVDRSSVALPGPASADDAAVLAVALRALGAGSLKQGLVRVVRGTDTAADLVLDRLGGDQLLIVPVALDTDHGAVMVISGDQVLTGPQWSDVARAVADELALALDNAYFYERALTRAANLETIFRISQAVGSSLQVNVVLNRVLDVVQKILSADAVALLEFDARRKALTTAMARGDVPQSIVQLELLPGDDVPGYVFSSGQPATLRDMHAGMHGVAGDAAALDLRSMLAVPLMARGRPIGVLIVFSKDAGAFTDEDTGVLQTFATQAALAIDTARLYSREHEVATVLQRSILPAELPEYAEVEAGSVYAPAGVDAEIGGDYYDLFRAPNGDIWFAIADVCGKGVHAATRTSMIKYSLRAFAAAGRSPAQVLSGINRMVSDAGSPSDIVTVWVGRLDEDASRLTWANGGHPPGLLSRSGGGMESLGVTGPLLGAIEEVTYDEMSVSVGPGDRVLLYTDGVTEARSGNIFFGEQRVCEVFDSPSPPPEVARELLDSVRRYVRADLRDDVAVLVVSLRRHDPEVADALGR